jgi:hydroxypyruvate isomerase
MALSLSRRKLLAAASATAFFAPYVRAAQEQAAPIRQGRLKQSVMSSVWGNSGFSFEERCHILSLLGFAAVDLPQTSQLSILKDYNLAPALMTGTGTSFQDGFVRRELHDKIEDATHEGIDMCAAAGCASLIGMPGERRGMSREEGKANVIEIMKRIAPYAEQKNVNVCMEITNSKVAADNRTDQMFDDIEWGFDICRAVGSPRIKVLYDCYHVQIANGDVVRTLRDNLEHVCHIHVAGVPSREEIDEGQELNYHYIAEQIADMGYEGYVAHEWRPGAGRNPVLSLATCFDILVV